MRPVAVPSQFTCMTNVGYYASSKLIRVVSVCIGQCLLNDLQVDTAAVLETVKELVACLLKDTPGAAPLGLIGRQLH